MLGRRRQQWEAYKRTERNIDGGSDNNRNYVTLERKKAEEDDGGNYVRGSRLGFTTLTYL